jgi:tetratricopeptide (TPR) repeat protein
MDHMTREQIIRKIESGELKLDAVSKLLAELVTKGRTDLDEAELVRQPGESRAEWIFRISEMLTRTAPPTEQVIRLDTYIREAAYDKAITECSEAIRCDAEDAVAYLYRGMAYKAKGEFDKAITDLDEAIRLDPENAVAYYHRGRAYYGRDDYEKAMADFNSAIRLDPEDSNYVWRGGLFYRRIAYERHASTNMGEADCDQEIAYWSEAIELDPAFHSAYAPLISAYSVRASTYFDKAEFDRAIVECFNSVRIDLLREKAGGDEEEEGDAEEDDEEQDEEKAGVFTKDLDDAIRCYPKKSYVGRGLRCVRREQWERAIEYFDHAIELGWEVSAAYYYRGVAYLREGKDGAANEDFDTATRLGYLRGGEYTAADDDDEDDLDFVVIEAEGEEDSEESQEDFGEAVWLNRQHPKARFYRWLARLCGGQFDEAIAEIGWAIRLYDAAGHVCRGIVQICKGDFNAAIADLDAAVRHDPRDATAHFCRGIVYGGKGRYDKAIADLEKAVELDAENAAAYYCRAIARLGKARAQADADFEEAKRRGYPATWWKPHGAGPAKEPDRDRINDKLSQQVDADSGEAEGHGAPATAPASSDKPEIGLAAAKELLKALGIGPEAREGPPNSPNELPF